MKVVLHAPAEPAARERALHLQLTLALLAPLRGGWLLLRTRALWPYALLPIGLGVVWSFVFVLERIALPELPRGAWYLDALGFVLELALAASAVLIQVLIALSAPLLDWLGEQTEEALGVLPRGPSFWRELFTLGFLRRGLRALIEALKLLGFKVSLYCLALPLSFIPEVGEALAYVLSGLATGIDFIDYPLARRDYPLARKLAWARANWLATLAFGAVVFALLSLPVAAALLLPVCVVGGTDLVFRLGGVSGQPKPRA